MRNRKFIALSNITSVELIDQQEVQSYEYTNSYIKHGLFRDKNVKVEYKWYNYEALSGKYPWVSFEAYPSYKTDDELLNIHSELNICGNKAFKKPRLYIYYGEKDPLIRYFDKYDDAKLEYERLLKLLNGYE